MDILAHGLWAGFGVVLLRRHRALAPGTALAAVALATLPDVVHLLPLVGWAALGDGDWSALRAYVLAMPGQEPVLPPLVQSLSHHGHCLMHSAVVAGAATALLWAWRRALWLPLLGWWSHILIDVFTHSARYYPVPVFYPFTDWAFDGIAWNQPWMLALNYAALGATAWWLHHTGWHRRAG